MPEVRFDRVEKRYGHQPVIRDFSLTIREGEFLTLVGPSGCGKSTVLNLVAGLEPVTSGEIYFDERAVTHLSPKARDVAMIFQSYALYPHKTVAENLAFPLQVRKCPSTRIESEVRRIAGLLGLEGLLDKKPTEISGGERQRVAVGRALIREPQVFLMDEPLSNLDAQLRVQTRSEIKRLHARLKTTTLYVTHDQEEALSLSDRIAVLNNGAIQQIGTPLDIYRCPSNIFVAKFIGSPQINLVPGRLYPGPPAHLDVGPIQVALVPDPALQADSPSPANPLEVLVGIRAEDVLVQGAPESLSGHSASVVDREPAGARSWVTLRWGSAEIKAETSSDFRIPQNHSVEVAINTERLHIFDAASGARLPWIALPPERQNGYK